jgi:L-seryl-tRNA(Ser) seleniumtransferase
VKDRFGNSIDVAVGYAWGEILWGPTAETYRVAWAREIIRRRAEKYGLEKALYDFTGLQGKFQLAPEDMKITSIGEWGAPAIFSEKLSNLAIEHLGGDRGKHDVVFFNRTSGGIILAELLLAKKGGTVVSLTPPPCSHSCVRRGAQLAGASFVEVSTCKGLERVLEERTGISLIVITGASIHVEVLPLKELKRGIELAKNKGISIFLDDASGARLRTVLNNQPKAFELGVDMAITSTYKAGLYGPRGGFLVAEKPFAKKLETLSYEYGFDARPSQMLSILRAIERWNPENLRKEAEIGDQIFRRAKILYGDKAKKRLGLFISEEDVLEIAMKKAGAADHEPSIVPMEASCGCGMILLEEYGIGTIASLGGPGCTFSVRLKPHLLEATRFGDPERIVAALDDALNRFTKIVLNPKKVAVLLLGDYLESALAGRDTIHTCIRTDYARQKYVRK